MHTNRFDSLSGFSFVMAVMAAIAMGHLDGVIQRDKQAYINVDDRPKNNRIDLKWSMVLIDADDGVKEWFTLLFRQGNRLAQLERSCDINFNASGPQRKITITLSAPTARCTKSGSHAKLEDLTGINLNFWPPKQVGDGYSKPCIRFWFMILYIMVSIEGRRNLLISFIYGMTSYI